MSGHLKAGDPLQQMEELAFMHGISCFIRDNTFYPIEYGGKLPYPDTQVTYKLKHLRPRDLGELNGRLKPILSETGTLNFDPATKVITVSDNPISTARIEEFLVAVDQPKAEITMEVQVLNVSRSGAIDWSASLGGSSTSQEMTENLNSALGFENGPRGNGQEITPRQISFDQSQIDDVLRTLGNRGQVEQISNQTLTTRDNDEVATNSLDLPHTRELDGAITVTPTVLPDGTIRMKMQAGQAAIDGDRPAVDDVNQPSMRTTAVTSLARVPVGQSLVVGGLLGESNQEDNLVMIITPTYSMPGEAAVSGEAAHPDPGLQPPLPPREP